MIVSFLHNMTLMVIITFILLNLRNYSIRKNLNRNFNWLIPIAIGLFSVAIMQEQFLLSIMYYLINYGTGLVSTKLGFMYWTQINGAMLLFGTTSCLIIYLMVNDTLRITTSAHELKTVVMQKEAILNSASEGSIISTDINGLITSYNPGAEQNHRDLIGRILNANHEAVVLSDAQGTVQYANQRMHDYFGFNPGFGDSIIVTCDKIHLHMAMKNASLYEQIRLIVSGSQNEIKDRFMVLSPTGETKHIELFATSIMNVSGQTKEILFVFIDRTEQEQLDEMKNNLISVISHELRTPLSSILGFIEIMLHREISKDKQGQYLQIVYSEANRLTELLNDFLDIQRMESGGQEYHFAPTDLTALVRDITEQWQKKPHFIEVAMTSDEMIVRGDNQKLAQVLHNLLSNAVKYSPEADKIHVAVKQTEDEIRIDVTDFGLGIPEKDISRLFTKFFRVEHSDRMQIRGTGLGLSICKEIVQAHGGALTVKSELGKGSTFSIHLKTCSWEPKITSKKPFIHRQKQASAYKGSFRMLIPQYLR